ncbi:glycoside hydrolase family 5 protein [Patellaria atrata CBS 101060]|uniref:Glycoside hydrolase family 5 protein n=1 Tax=Patellaria atrata CBS 101060 TaxID=1346257 RepID=A0A9P4S6J4_9PEZI|nr:glycoside hydrolase family 5 protein [Patellaria atrata CBS 101060]
MFSNSVFFIIISILSFTLKIHALSKSAPHHSFAGVNHFSLPFLEPTERDATITELVNANVSVIRLMITGNEKYPDPEFYLHTFDQVSLDRFDDTLAAIHRISKGKTKVIIAPHDVHALRGTNNAKCDVYCQTVGEPWLDFYTNETIREWYRLRLTIMFFGYESKNFNGRKWRTLNETILGVDLQNEPFQGVWPIPVGMSWFCDIAEHLKISTGLGESNIAVITGGISSPVSPGGHENFPQQLLECDAIDVIGIHGYWPSTSETPAGTLWANLLSPQSQTSFKARGTKLILVEALTYIIGEKGISGKFADIWEQANAINLRGVPWLFASTSQNPDVRDVEIDVHDSTEMKRLGDLIGQANSAPSEWDWNKYLKQSPFTKHQRNNTVYKYVHPNPYLPIEGQTILGRENHLCSANDDCHEGLICKNNVCQQCVLGCEDMMCNRNAFCQPGLKCVKGICKKTKLTLPKDSPHQFCTTEHTCPNTPIMFLTCDPRTMDNCAPRPCMKATDCNLDEECSNYTCKPCTEGCIGDECRMQRACKTGYCNPWYRKCDVPPKKKKNLLKPGTLQSGRGHYRVERGASRPRDNARVLPAKPEVPKAT